MAKREDQQQPLDLDRSTKPQGPVECLGMTFESEDARRAYFLERLKEKLPELRKRHDFPLGPDGGPAADEDILRLSDPPYYTACPNPFLDEFVKHYGRPYDPDEHYHREPFAVDVSEGKYDPLYKIHSYPTKVPFRAIMRYILHFTDPGDLVFDGFCGTGMTGVAAMMCGDKTEVMPLAPGQCSHNRIGCRRFILCDLSPHAAHIAFNYTRHIDSALLQSIGREFLVSCRVIK